MATERQVAANRINGLKGGVKTEAGKAISRLNARKHGIFASALTEGDSEELRGVLDELVEELEPVGIVERLLVDKLAVTYLRMQRCARAEALHFRTRWNSNPANFGKFGYDETVVQIGVYDARLTGQFLRLLRELEHRQERRRSPECRTTAAQNALQVEESAGKAGQEEEVKNEPNSAIAECRLPSAECNEEWKNEPNSAVTPAESPTTTHETLDSRLRGNDNEEVENEPNEAEGAMPAEMKIEPNSPVQCADSLDGSDAACQNSGSLGPCPIATVNPG